MVIATLPVSKRDVLKRLARGDGPIVAGGTDLMVKRRRWPGVVPALPETAVYVAALPELRGVAVAADGITIGAATPLSALLADPRLPALLRSAIGETAAPAIRATATLGGNLANASPAADPALALACLDARVRLESLRGVRDVPVFGFITGPGRTLLQTDELIVSVFIPTPAATVSVFTKVGGRKADAIAKVAFAGTVRIEAGRLASFRAAFGAVGPTVVRLPATEAGLAGLAPAELKRRRGEIRDAYAAAIRPIDDQRSTAVYRRDVALALLDDFIEHL